MDTIKYQTIMYDYEVQSMGVYIPQDFMMSEGFKKLSGNELKVLIVLMSYMKHKTMQSFPKVSDISKITGISEHAICAILQKLKKKGFIKITKRKSDCSVNYHNVYDFQKEYCGVVLVELPDPDLEEIVSEDDLADEEKTA